MTTESECQRFFALSKRVPKDVKRYCGICRQHGVLLETRGHMCTFKDCTCNKCELVRTRRRIMSQQIRLRRAQDKRFQRTNEPTQADVIPMKQNNELAPVDAAQELGVNAEELLMDAKSMCYFCQKCKNHEVLVWKKQHKRQCPYTDCTCEKCELIETRRRLDQHMKKRKASAALDDCSENGTLMNNNNGASICSEDRSTPQSHVSTVSHSPKSIRLSTASPDDSSKLPLSPPQSAPIKIEDAFNMNLGLDTPMFPVMQQQQPLQTICIPVMVPVQALQQHHQRQQQQQNIDNFAANFLQRQQQQRQLNNDTTALIAQQLAKQCGLDNATAAAVAASSFQQMSRCEQMPVTVSANSFTNNGVNPTSTFQNLANLFPQLQQPLPRPLNNNQETNQQATPPLSINTNAAQNNANQQQQNFSFDPLMAQLLRNPHLDLSSCGNMRSFREIEQYLSIQRQQQQQAQ